MTWPQVPMLDVVRDVSGGNAKIPQREYEPHGVLAVVDQGQNLVGGYTNDVNARHRSDGPVIVFGDHTKAVKFVDFPFAMGADGVKVLRVQSGWDPRFVYHYIRTLCLPDVGYSRHFKFLKEHTVPMPPLGEQRHIAVLLDTADALRASQDRALQAMSSLEEAIYRSDFSAESAQTTVGEIAEKIRTGPFGSQLLHGEFVDEGIAVLGLDNVVGNEFRWVERRFITEAKYDQLRRYTVHPGDVLISIMGTTGRCVVVPDDIPLAINTKHICAISAKSELLLPAFLRASFLWHPDSRAHLRRRTKGSIMDGLNMEIIKSMPIPIPPLPRQERYAATCGSLARSRSVAARQGRRLDELFAALEARAFAGML